MGPKQGERTRRRLSTEARREELLAVGARLFASRPHGEVSIEQVAEIAGVSRGLLYHYFPTKNDFIAAVVERENRRMLRLTAATPGVPVHEQLTTGLDRFLAYVEEHAQGFRAFHRAESAGDPALLRVYREGLAGIPLRRCGRRAIAAAAAMYRAILRQIEREGYGARRGRPVVPTSRKLLVAARARG